ncbi:hypothetical protein SUGI_1033630, partial [Cryptomeria japonica]
DGELTVEKGATTENLPLSEALNVSYLINSAGMYIGDQGLVAWIFVDSSL